MSTQPPVQRDAATILSSRVLLALIDGASGRHSLAQIGALSGTPGRFGDLAAEDQENHSVTIAATLGDFTAANPSAAALIAEEIKQRRPFAKELAANIRGTPGLYQAFDQSTAGQGILRALDKRGLDYIPRENSIHF